MPFFLRLTQPMIVWYDTKNGKQSKTLPVGTDLPVIRKYEPKKKMHRLFPYDVLIEGIGLRRMGKNKDAYQLVEINDDELPDSTSEDKR